MLLSLFFVLTAHTQSMAADPEVLLACRPLHSQSEFSEADGDLRAGYVGPFSEFNGLFQALEKGSRACNRAENPKALAAARARFQKVRASAADFLDETKNAPVVLRDLAARAEKAGEESCAAELAGFAVRTADAHEALGNALRAASEICRKGVPVLR